MTTSKEAQLLVKMSRAQKLQLTEMAQAEGVPVRAYVLHHLFGVSYTDLPLSAGGQPRHKRPAAQNQPPLPAHQEVTAA